MHSKIDRAAVAAAVGFVPEDNSTHSRYADNHNHPLLVAYHLGEAVVAENLSTVLLLLLLLFLDNRCASSSSVGHCSSWYCGGGDGRGPQ